MTSVLRLSITALLALAVAGLAGCGAPAGLGDAAAARPYAKPGRLVELPDGRRINLRCSGRGSPTLILESGFAGSSEAWSKVQPQLARKTRTCAYDRAGYGFSDPGPLPRDGAAIARDLDAALKAARIAGPYVVVGHSAGGLYARLFAARRPGEVQGLVLLDPTVEHVAASPEADGLTGMRRRLQGCLRDSETFPKPPAGDAGRACAGAGAGKHALQVAERPDTWRNQLSELDAIFGRTSQSVMRLGGLLRDIPVYVITASETADRAPMIRFYPTTSAWTQQHLELAARFSNGSQRTVISSHLVMLDRPDVVIDAVQTMVLALRAGEAPPALPPSESANPPGGGDVLPGEASPASPTDLVESLGRATIRRLTDLDR